jgi:hypothetical protein
MLLNIMYLKFFNFLEEVIFMAVNQNNDDRARESAKKAKEMSPSIQYAIVQVLPNIMNGAFWGFTDMKGISQHIDAIKDSNGRIVARQLGNACLVEVDPNYLIQAVRVIDPEAIKNKDVETITQKRAEASIAFEKFLISKGKSSKKTGQPFAGTIGIYCTNDVTSIIYKNVSYPAFRVEIATALRLLEQYGYKVKVNGQFVTPTQAAQSGQALWSSVVLSPTKTGLFIDVTCTYSSAQIEELEKQYKARNNIK